MRRRRSLFDLTKNNMHSTNTLEHTLIILQCMVNDNVFMDLASLGKFSTPYGVVAEPLQPWGHKMLYEVTLLLMDDSKSFVVNNSECSNFLIQPVTFSCIKMYQDDNLHVPFHQYSKYSIYLMETCASTSILKCILMPFAELWNLIEISKFSNAAEGWYKEQFLFSDSQLRIDMKSFWQILDCTRV